MEVRVTCPFGSECEKARDGYIERCAWYTEIEGKNPQNGERINEWRCAISWLPMLQIESNGVNISTNAAIESMRNETVKRQDLALGVMANAKAIKSE